MKRLLAIATALFLTGTATIHAINRVTVKATECQRITGFGAAALGNLMAPIMDTDIIDWLYGPESPVGLNIMRIEMNPCREGDVQWTDYDWHGYLPVVKRANQYGATVFATPWTPPGDMKTNNSGSGGEADGVHGKLKTDCYSKLFPWMNQFLGYMTQNGAHIDIVSVQNEPDWWVSYEGCEYTPEEMTTLVAENGHLLKKDRYKVRLMGSESLNHNPAYARALLGNPDSEKYIDIIGGHIYGSRPLSNMKKTAEIASAHGKETWMTEHYIDGEEGHFFPTWDNNLIFAQELNESMLAGANAYVLWYMVGAGSFVGDGVKVDEYPDNEWGKPVMPRSMIMAHFSKNLIGATRLETTPEVPEQGSAFESSAYIKGDSLIVMMLNMEGARNTAKLDLPYDVVSGKMIQSVENDLYKESDLAIASPANSFNIILPAKSLTTYIYKIDPSVTSISTVEEEKPMDDGYYTLDGVRHSSPVKGINIHNGKKMILN